MKYILFTISLIVSISVFGQSTHKQEEKMKSYLWLDIWDLQEYSEKFKIDKIGYDDIPRELEFRGILVEALKWTDTIGTNILVLTQTGGFKYKDYVDSDSTNYMIQPKSEINAYLFVKKTGQKSYKRTWKIYDYVNCFGVDMYAGFYQRSMTVTDLDNDGKSEITILYKLTCRGGADPGIMKAIMYESTDKYALRGKTAICYKGEDGNEYRHGGEYKADDDLKIKTSFLNFMTSQWEAHVCDDFKQFR